MSGGGYVRCALCNELHATFEVGAMRFASCPKLSRSEAYMFSQETWDMLRVTNLGHEPEPTPAHTASCPRCGSLCTTSAMSRDTVRVELLTSVQTEERDCWLLGCECGHAWRATCG